MKPARKYSVAVLAPRIERFLSPLLRGSRLDLHFEIQEGAVEDRDWESPDVVVNLSGSDVDLLLANRAELLLALEHLTIQMLGIPSEDHERVCFDARHYRQLRIEELRLSATAAAERVRRSGKPFQFNPMSSRERRIIHLALRDQPGVRSESQGLGPSRRVVIHPVPASRPARAPSKKASSPASRSVP